MRLPMLGSFAQDGASPHRSRHRWRPFASWRTAATACVGAILKWGEGVRRVRESIEMGGDLAGIPGRRVPSSHDRTPLIATNARSAGESTGPPQ
jgi:hypothetical protein